jgi:Protein SCAI
MLMKFNNLQELDKQIVDYTSTYEPDDQLEWSLVLEEIKSFIKSDSVISVLHADSNPIILSHR